MDVTTVSAPGKVLLTGGYLVLERPNAGLVLSVSSRFHASVASARGGERVAASEGGSVRVTVESPQFETVAVHDVHVGKNFFAPSLLQSNPYVGNALLWSLAFVRHCGRSVPTTITVRLCAANDFYSMADELQRRGLPPTSASLASLPPFLRLGSSMGAMRKTGLGSSAALVTSLVAAVCVHCGASRLPEDVETLHQLAQFAHCLAQGKIGSGFDVASACFGSQRYVRFSPSLLDPHLKRAADGDGGVDFGALLAPWDSEHAAASLPRGMQLVLGDVSVGSNTPLMVGQVLRWRAANPAESDELWRDIAGHNAAFGAALEAVKRCDAAELAACGRLLASEWPAGPCGDALRAARRAFAGARAGLKRMGQLAGVPVEPDAQTRLCDASETHVAGVVCCGVPGAGGQDAVAALVVGPEAAARLEALWQGWTECSVLPLLVREDPRGLVLEP